jgi:DegV family protein with EDD domain
MSPSLRDQYDIAVVPLGFLFGDTLYVDNVSLSQDEFYALLKSARELPTTASPPPGDFLETFRAAYRQDCKEILCIVTSRGLTGTYSAASSGAELARQEMPDIRIRVMDSRCAAASLGFVVLAAAKAAADSATLDQAAARAEDLIPRIYMLGILDTLEYVARGGRVPQVFAWFSSLLQVKPIFQFHDGEISRLGAVRTKPRAIARMLELTRQRIQPHRPLHAAVFHAHAPEEAADLAARVQDEFRPVDLYSTEFSQAMSIHTGPGLVGLAFYNEP